MFHPKYFQPFGRSRAKVCAASTLTTAIPPPLYPPSASPNPPGPSCARPFFFQQTPASSDPRKSQRWYLHDVHRVSDEEKEHGPRSFHATPRAPPHGSARQNRNNSTASNPHDAANPLHAAAAHLRDDPSIGPKATKLGGGWMGAQNGGL